MQNPTRALIELAAPCVKKVKTMSQYHPIAGPGTTQHIRTEINYTKTEIKNADFLPCLSERFGKKAAPTAKPVK